MIPRVKTSDLVARHLVGEFLHGRLRPGERLDLEQIAATLGVSRAPVREAVLALERDGIVRMPFHRGAFLADIDSAAVREGFTLYALLSGLTATLATRLLDDDLLRELAARVEEAQVAAGAGRGAAVEHASAQFRRALNQRAAGPHLRSLLRTFTGLVRELSLLAVDLDPAAEAELLRTEFEAVRSGDPADAARAAIAHVQATGERGLTLLRESGVVADTDGDWSLSLADLEPLVAAAAGARS